MSLKRLAPSVGREDDGRTGGGERGPCCGINVFGTSSVFRDDDLEKWGEAFERILQKLTRRPSRRLT